MTGTFLPAIAIPFLIVFSRGLSGQADEKLVALSAHLNVRTPAYIARIQDGQVVFRDTWTEPLELIVEVGNHAGQAIELGSDLQSWLEAVSFVTRQKVGPTGTQRFQGISIRPWPNGASARTPETLRDGSVALARFAVERNHPVTSGIYELAVSLDANALSLVARGLNNLLARKVVFELREATTKTEIADAYLQLGYRALSRGRFQEAREWSQKVLQVHPDSLPAVTDIAASWLGEGNCSRAVPEIQRAISLIRSGADPDLYVNRDEWATSLTQRAAACTNR